MSLSPNPVRIRKNDRKRRLQCELPEGDQPWGIGDVFTAAGGLIDAGVVYFEWVNKHQDLNLVEGLLVVGDAVTAPNELQVQVLCGGAFHNVKVKLR